jgi:4-diphosphocytidyl-2-C-methyl-D-erythritol kinase
MTNCYSSECPAKINLFLKITGKNQNYHDLESVITFLDLKDKLEVSLSEKFELIIDGEFANFIDKEKNLFTEITNFFVKNFHINSKLKIKLNKQIPIGAGLGGGSSNAACFLRSLNKIFSLNLSSHKLKEISFVFGSDIAFFLEEKASLIRGRGFVNSKISSLESIPTLIVNPRIILSTKEVFDNFIKIKNKFSLATPDKEIIKKTAIEMIKEFPNDLTQSAIILAPIIKKIIEVLLNQTNSIAAKMSGSGSSCFAIYHDYEELEKASQKVQKIFPDFFIRKTTINFIK